jgi:hypothetical protein
MGGSLVVVFRCRIRCRIRCRNREMMSLEYDYDYDRDNDGAIWDTRGCDKAFLFPVSSDLRPAWPLPSQFLPSGLTLALEPLYCAPAFLSGSNITANRHFGDP